MSRQPRQFIPGFPVHLVHRGNNRAPLFGKDSDYLFFRHCLEDRRRFDVALHSYVLMTNHVHLLVTPGNAESISRFIQSVARRYVGYFNAHYERTGTLWEGRFHSSPIRVDRYVLACHRYIDMNPVRAGMVAAPGDYLWSSYRRLGLGIADTLVDPHPLVASLAHDARGQEASYRALFEGGSEPEWDCLRIAVQGCLPVDEKTVRRPLGRPPKNRL